MDTLSFVVEMTKALAWPLAVLVLVFAFRPELIRLVKALKRGKFGSAEFEFEQEALELAIQPAPNSARSSAAAAVANSSDLRGSILTAWLELEDKVIDFAMRNSLANPSAHRYPKSSVDAFLRSDRVTDEMKSTFVQLRDLRNLAVHHPDFEPTRDSVIAFVSSCATLGASLDGL